MSKQAKVLDRAEWLWGKKRLDFGRRYYNFSNFGRHYFVLGEGLGIKLFSQDEEAEKALQNQRAACRRLRNTGLIVPQAYGTILVVLGENIWTGLVMDHIPSASLNTRYKVRYDGNNEVGRPAKRGFKAEVILAEVKLAMLKRGVEHTDIHSENVRITKQNKIAVIDWDWANFV